MAKKYDKEFKLQTVRLVQEEGKTVAKWPGRWACMRTRSIAGLPSLNRMAVMPSPAVDILSRKIKRCVTSKNESCSWDRESQASSVLKRNRSAGVGYRSIPFSKSNRLILRLLEIL